MDQQPVVVVVVVKTLPFVWRPARFPLAARGRFWTSAATFSFGDATEPQPALPSPNRRDSWLVARRPEGGLLLP
jgi:hypothetical protein